MDFSKALAGADKAPISIYEDEALVKIHKDDISISFYLGQEEGIVAVQKAINRKTDLQYIRPNKTTSFFFFVANEAYISDEAHVAVEADTNRRTTHTA